MEMYQERFYQTEAVECGWKELLAGYNPVIALPTASGKSLVLCGLVNKILTHDFDGGVLILSHNMEIIEQNANTLEEYFDHDGINIYCSTLNRKEIGQITVASIASIFRSPKKFRRFNYVIIDECHLVNSKNKGMYRTFLIAIGAQCLGLSATPYRLGSGYIYIGKNTLFDSLAIDYTSTEKYNLLVEEGYLSEMYTKKTLLELNTDDVSIQDFEYDQTELSSVVDRSDITKKIVEETIHFGKNYKKWLCFTIDIEHCENITAEFIKHGISAVAIHSKMESDRKTELNKFKRGEYRLAVNVNTLTTGLDIKTIDLIIVIKPTNSESLHVQMNGRGARVFYADGFDLYTKEGRLNAIKAGPKQHCLVLDFAKNSDILGPINGVVIKQRESTEKAGEGEAPIKVCPECDFYNPINQRNCINCNYVFPVVEKITTTSSTSEILIKKPVSLIAWETVESVQYQNYVRTGAMLVTYKLEKGSMKEWINLDKIGNARSHAINWVRWRWSSELVPAPKTTHTLLAYAHCLKVPKEILIDNTKQYPVIKDSVF